MTLKRLLTLMVLGITTLGCLMAQNQPMYRLTTGNEPQQVAPTQPAGVAYGSVENQPMATPNNGLATTDAPLKIPTGTLLGGQKATDAVALQATTGSQKAPAMVSGTDPSELPALPPRRAASNTMAPMPVTGLTAEFPNGSLTGTVSFTMPTKRINGIGLSSSKLLYVVKLYKSNSELLGTYTGSVQPGEQVSTNIEWNQPQQQAFLDVEVQELSTHFYSDGVRYFLSVGEFAPIIPEDPILTKLPSQDVLELSWKIQPKGSRKEFWAYYNPDELSFKIVRQPDNVVVEENFKGTTFTESAVSEDLRGYWYEVYIKYKGIQMNNAYCFGYNHIFTSNRIALGKPVSIPYNAFNSTSQANEEWSTWSELYDSQTIDMSHVHGWSLSNTSSNQPFCPRFKASTLVSPPLDLKAGVYKVSLDFHEARDGYIYEKPLIFVNYGTDPSIEGLNQPLSFVRTDTTMTVVSYDPYIPHCTYIKIDEDQVGYVALYSPSNSDNGFMNFKVEAMPSLEVPDTVCQLVAEPTALGAMQARISFVTPTTDARGKNLASISKVDVYRCDAESTLLTSFSNPNPGQHLECIDNTPIAGYNPYKVVAYNEYGEGIPRFVEGYIGLDQPCDVDSVWINIVNNKVQVSWTPVTQGAEGFPVGQVTYTIIDVRGNIYADDVEGTSVQLPLVINGAQPQFMVLYVGAKNSSGVRSANFIRNTILPVIGEAEKLSCAKRYYEDFSQAAIGALTEWMGVQKHPLSEMLVINGWTLSTAWGTDGERGCITCNASATGNDNCHSVLCTRNFDLSSLNNPYLSFYVKFDKNNQFNHNVPINTESLSKLIVTMVKDYSAAGLQLEELTAEAMGDGEWHLIEIPLLDALGEKIVRFEFDDFVPKGNYSNWSIDDIRVSEKYSSDLELVVFSAPSSIKYDHTGEITFYVANYGDGIVSANHYMVNVYRNGEYQMSLPTVALSPYQKHIYTVNALGQRIDDEVNYRFVVNDKSDGILENNADSVTIVIEQPRIPKPINLIGEEQNGKAALQWDAPDMSDGIFYAVIEDGAENYGDYNLGGITKTEHEGHLGKWTVFNGNTEDVQSYTPYGMGYMAWGALDVRKMPENLRSAYEPHSGDHVFFSNSITTDQFGTMIDANHWLVSPKLSGHEQTIKWCAKAVKGELQFLDILYTTDEALAGSYFYTIDQRTYRPNGMWYTNEETTVPEGTTYVCFLYYTTTLIGGMDTGCGLLLDDIELEIEADASELEVQDYNVYRDNKIIATGVTDTHYVDVLPKPGVYTYRVSANYAEAGESALSNEVELFILNPTGPDEPYNALDDLTADGQVTVRPVDGGIEVCNASDQLVSIYNVAGQLMARVTAHSDVETITLAPGIYLVTAGNRVDKILVK